MNLEILYELYCKIREEVATEEDKESFRLEIEASCYTEEYLMQLLEDSYVQEFGNI